MLRDVPLFAEVAKTKSIRRAAEALGIPDSTLSRRLTALEQSLGIKLLHRSTRRIELTDAGQLYYARCKEIVAAAQLAEQQLKDLAETPQGRLRLSLPVDFSALFVAPLIAEFAEFYPKLTFDLQLSERWSDLIEDGIDVAIRLGHQPDSPLTARHLGDIRYELYASPEYLLRSGSPSHPRDLIKHSCIRMVCPHWSDKWTLLNERQIVTVDIGERVAANNIGLVQKCATLGLGIAPLDGVLAREDLRAGRLRRVLPRWHFESIPVFALTSGKPAPAKTSAFVQFMARRLKVGEPEVIRSSG